ncbi:hypothetical protein [Tistrella mobilis]|uniref:hypothetical protein n=1 Tax=Tistrella mobilis TaxID=171437 RepID=UPI003557FC0F
MTLQSTIRIPARLRVAGLLAAAAFASLPARAQQVVDIGTVASGNEGTTLLTKFFQSWVNFMTGPWAVAMMAASIAVGVAIWIFMPREGPMGWVARGAIGGLVLLNLGPWLADLGYIGLS